MHRTRLRHRSGVAGAWLEIKPQFAEALLGMEVGHELVVITWYEARRDVLKGHPRSDKNRPLTGVFYTRSPVRLTDPFERPHHPDTEALTYCAAIALGRARKTYF